MLHLVVSFPLLVSAALFAEPPPAPRWVVLQVRVVPSLDPAGKPWKVQLLEKREGKDEVFADEPAPANRNLELKVVEKHGYSLRLRTGDGDTWFTDPEPFEAAGEMALRTLEPKAEKVRGLVTLGRRPLEKARLVFGSEGGFESVAMTSRGDGIFEGFLPRFGRWHVAATTEAPDLHREVDVQVIHSDRGALLDVEVRLIPKGVEGEIVDVNGERVLKAGINLSGPGDHRDDILKDGTFHFDGLSEGTYYVNARTRYPGEDGKGHFLRSEELDVAVEAGTADPAWLRIVLKEEKGLKGRVLSPSGTGVTRADVYDLGSRAKGRIRFTPHRSDADGRFLLPELEGTPDTCIAVVPKEFALRILRIAITGDEQDVPVGATGGTILVDSPFWSAKRLEGKTVAIFHLNCALSPNIFWFFARNSRTDSGDRWRFTFPNLEAGSYSFCAVTAAELAAYAGEPVSLDSCVSGALAPGGLLELKLLP